MALDIAPDLFLNHCAGKESTSGGTTLKIRQPWRRGLVLAVVMSPLALLLAPPALPAGEPTKLLRAQAEQFEKLRDWGAAASKYDEILRLDRGQADVRERYNYCLRRYYQVVRLRDPSYRKEVLPLKFPQAVRLYEIVVFNLLHHALDKGKVPAGDLFRTGLDEFRLALTTPEFCQDHLGGLKPDDTRALRSLLQAEFGGRKTMTLDEATQSVRDAVMRSVNCFPNINPTTVVMEFLCGACVAMDDYTVYLTPRQLRELCATLKGTYVGVGIRLHVDNHRMLVAQVQRESPAAELSPPLAPGDQIVEIDKKSTLDMTAETAQEMLEGEEGSTVELVVLSPVHGFRFMFVRRRAMLMPSVHHEVLGNVGILKIHCFQESTVHEFDTHLAELLKVPCKALVLDLRGNPGGLVDTSIEIARRFISAGVIVSAQQWDSKTQKVYRSDNAGALTIPVVVLVNGDTASAAEVLAGALKDNHRARVVGQTTHGKGSAQGLLRLPAEADLRLPAASSTGGLGGIRITVARFYSPTGQPYNGRGVEPDVFAEGEMQLYEAVAEAQQLQGQH